MSAPVSAQDIADFVARLEVLSNEPRPPIRIEVSRERYEIIRRAINEKPYPVDRIAPPTGVAVVIVPEAAPEFWRVFDPCPQCAPYSRRLPSAIACQICRDTGEVERPIEPTKRRCYVVRYTVVGEVTYLTRLGSSPTIEDAQIFHCEAAEFERERKRFLGTEIEFVEVPNPALKGSE